MNDIKYFICPMSKNIADAVLELNDVRLGLLPSRRQIDYDTGYTGWTTKTFKQYVGDKVIIERDHGGPQQGTGHREYDCGMLSFSYDGLYFDVVHIDVWKALPDFDSAVNQIITVIKFLYQKNPNVKYEIGTEEAIRKMSTDDINKMLDILLFSLTEEEFNNILYVVVQSGVRLDVLNKKNIGNFDNQRLLDDIAVCKKYNKLAKEHNGDFLTEEQHRLRFGAGLSSINIGPELSILENELYLEHMSDEDIDNFYKICRDSDTWRKWVPTDFDVNDKKSLIRICGHYNYFGYKLPDVSTTIKESIKNRLRELLTYAE